MSRRPPITTLPDTRFPYPTLFRSVDGAVAVLDQLDHFGSARRGGDTGAAHELAIEGHRAARATRRDAADAAVVVDELNEDASRKHAFGTIGAEDVRCAAARPWALVVGSLPDDQRGYPFVVAGWRGSF